MTSRWMATGWVALGCLAPALAGGADKPDSEAGWTALFDGKTLEGWTPVPLGKQATNWEVKDGVIEGSGAASMLYSPRGDYKNFKYRAEVKINDQGNSGMYVRTPKGATFSNGYEIQVNATHRDPIKTGSIYTLVHLEKAVVPPIPGSPRRSRSPTSITGASWSRSSGSRSTASCSSSTSTTTDSGRRATSPSSSTTPAARSRSARSR